MGLEPAHNDGASDGLVNDSGSALTEEGQAGPGLSNRERRRCH